jgi:outer membrane putative beta-barrel porin/alpha-amylase
LDQRSFTAPIRRAARSAATAALLVGALSAGVTAQDMEPKAYSASPVGANFLVAAFNASSGSIVTDEALPLADVNAHVRGLGIGLGHTFNLFDKLALASATMPYAWATVTGKIQEQAAETHRSGLADARLKFSINLRGNDAMTAREFMAAPRRMIIGASLTAVAPAGQYYPTKLINIGANRWAYKPELGVSVPKGKWDIDAYGGVWLFADTSDYFPGTARKSQSPIVAIQGHASYTVRPRLWIAADGTWYSGGSVQVNDGPPSASLNNSRLGVTTSLPIGRRYSLKVAYTSGVIVRTGTNFRTVAVGWQMLWFSPRWSGR